MSPLETVKAFYAALGKGDVPAVLALLNDDLSWTEAEGFPYFSGTWRTPQEVLEKLLVPLSQDWEGFSARPESFVSDGEEVVSFGNYGGTHRGSGRGMAAPFAHRWRVVAGRVVLFIQYTDTALVQAAAKQ